MRGRLPGCTVPAVCSGEVLRCRIHGGLLALHGGMAVRLGPVCKGNDHFTAMAFEISAL